MHKIAASFFVTALVVTSFGIPAASAAPVSTMTLSPNNTAVSTGESFALSIIVDPNGQSLDTARVDLSWDPTLLEVVAFDLGSQFPNASPNNYMNNVTGFLSQGMFKFGLPVTEKGTLGTVTYRALKSGAPSISVGTSSKLIANGAEALNKDALGSSVISIDGAPVAPTPPPATPDSEDDVPVESAGNANAEAQALVYFGAFAGRLPANGAEWEALHCIAYGGCQWSPKNQPREEKALGFYTQKYGALPGNAMEWNAIHAIAYTDVFLTHTDGLTAPTSDAPSADADEMNDAEETPVLEEPNEKEVKALEYFGALTGHLPENGVDWEALHCMAYGGCALDPRNLTFENEAVALFVEKIGRAPSADMDWNVVHAIAYTNAVIDHGDAVNPVPATEGTDTDGDGLTDEEETTIYNTDPNNPDSDGDGYSDSTEVNNGYDPNCAAGDDCEAPSASSDDSATANDDASAVDDDTAASADDNDSPAPSANAEAENEAIGWFGTLKGVLPSTDADWLAVNYMVNGYTPDVQNIQAEAAAISLFSSRFGRLPSSDADWRIISAIAYSGAF